MIEFDAVVKGDRTIQARFAKWPEEIHDRLLERIKRLTAELYGRVRELAPSGNTPHKEGEKSLKDELISKVYDNQDNIKGVVTLQGQLGPNEYIKAAALEYGAHGSADVRPYRRTITEAFGRTISPMRIMVRGYSRRVNIEEHAFLRGGLAAIEAEAVAEMTATINEVIKE